MDWRVVEGVVEEVEWVAMVDWRINDGIVVVEVDWVAVDGVVDDGVVVAEEWAASASASAIAAHTPTRIPHGDVLRVNAEDRQGLQRAWGAGWEVC
jgi:hypothetical protein